MGILRKYIRKMLKEALNISASIPPPPAESVSELNEVIYQYQNRYNSEQMQNDLDTNMGSVFDEIIMSSGYTSDIKNIEKFRERHVDTIHELKNHYSRARPDNVAQQFGVDWVGDGINMDTDDTFSYPSGHACQAYYIALNLADTYPDLRAQFLQVAEMVAQSRIDRGVHFPSDIAAGKLLAFQLYSTEAN